MGAVLSRPWLPYQRFIGQVAGEKRPDGAYAHPIVLLTMPRQSAKTTTIYDICLGRGRGYRNYRCRYSTHKGTITSERYVDWFSEIELHPGIAEQMKLRMSRGTESIGWRRTKSYFQAFPARKGALRSAALDLVVVDEAQEHDAALGKTLKEMIGATFNTRDRHQLWIVFSAGTDESAYAAEYIGRAKDGDPLIAWFDYGCPPDVDPTDPRHWLSWHPGLAYGLTNRGALEVALADSAAVFTREYGNIWTRTAAGPLIPADMYEAAKGAAGDMPPGRLCVGVDVELDRSGAAISLAGPDRYLELMETVTVDQAAARLLELADLTGGPIALDSVGPVGTVLDTLRRKIPAADHEHRLLVMKMQDVANAAAGWLDDLKAGGLHIWPDPDVDAAVEGAAQRTLGEGWAWSKRHSASKIAPLVSMCAARWGHDHLPPEPARPEVFSA